jgi:hypothetical protein
MEQELKEKVLSGMMEFMDELEGDKLKSHPRLMAAKMEVKPKESEEMPEISESPEMEKSEDEVDPEMLAKLMEMLQEK